MHVCRSVLFLFLPILTFVSGDSPLCIRRPSLTTTERTIGNNGFKLDIEDEQSGEKPQGYVPGQLFSMKLYGRQTRYTIQTFRGFGLIARTVDKNVSAGRFDVSENSEAIITPECPEGVGHVNLHPKTSVRILWLAPDSNVGCVNFHAMVLEYRHVWYMDEGPLTRRLCPISNSVKQLSNDKAGQCCACDEAKYEMIFDGIWSPETHPKDFPSRKYLNDFDLLSLSSTLFILVAHLTHFSDIIGASHSKQLVMWTFDSYASNGLKELAEWGNTYKFEQELRDQAKEVRTIIKTKGLWYPDVQDETKATFRVDKYHHLASLATMFGPSPDWCVGVSSVDLCTNDCTWINEKKIDLYPWDAGTDNGATYMSPNNPAVPREKIAKLTSKSDSRSPFYDDKSAKMHPMARLTLRRISVSSMDCKTDEQYRQMALNATTSEDEEYKDRLRIQSDKFKGECMVGVWSSWSLCSATCGKGIRMRSRVYKFAVKAQMFNCQRQVTEKQFCNAPLSVCEDSADFNDKCSMHSWGDWTECSVTCGRGKRSRTRNFLNPTKASGSGCDVQLLKQDICIGDGGDDCSVTASPLCRTTFWSNWSPCSVSCGDGIRVRTRLLFYVEHERRCSDTRLMQKESCSIKKSCRYFFVRHSSEICRQNQEPGQCAGIFPRYWYDSSVRNCRRFIYTGCKGNRNRFETKEQCKTACLNGYKHEIGGIASSSHLTNVLSLHDTNVNDGGLPVNCMVTEWTPWSNCSAHCGDGKRQRTRSIKVLPRNNGQVCPSRMVQQRRCQMRPCPSRSCRITEWTSWSPCPVTCGHGVQLRRRHVILSNDRDLYSLGSCHLPKIEGRQCNSFVPCFR